MINYKEIYVIPGIDEEVPENSILLISDDTKVEILHSIVQDDYKTAGTILWETGMNTNLIPNSKPPHKFAGWDGT